MNDLEALEHLFPAVHAVALEQRRTERTIEEYIDVDQLLRYKNTNEGYEFWELVRNKKWEEARKLQPDLFPWRAEKGGDYWSLIEGVVVCNQDFRRNTSTRRYLEHNYFRTEQEARKPKFVGFYFATEKDRRKYLEGEWKGEEKSNHVPKIGEYYFRIDNMILCKYVRTKDQSNQFFLANKCFSAEGPALDYLAFIEDSRRSGMTYGGIRQGKSQKIVVQSRDWIPKKGEQYFKVEKTGEVLEQWRGKLVPDDYYKSLTIFLTRKQADTYANNMYAPPQAEVLTPAWIPELNERYYVVIERTNTVHFYKRHYLEADIYFEGFTYFATTQSAVTYLLNLEKNKGLSLTTRAGPDKIELIKPPQAELNKTPAENPLTEWRAEEGKEYFCVYQDLLTKCRDYRLPVDNERYTSGNYFKAINDIPSNISYKSLIHPKNLKVTTEDPSPTVSPTEKETYAPSLFENTKTQVGPLAHLGIK